MEFGGKFVYLKKKKSGEDTHVEEEEQEEFTEEDLNQGLTKHCSPASADDGKVSLSSDHKSFKFCSCQPTNMIIIAIY